MWQDGRALGLWDAGPRACACDTRREPHNGGRLLVTTMRFGNLAIGTIPRVVGTVTDPATLQMLPGEQAPVCDIVELRVDLLDLPPDVWLAHGLAIQAAGRPVFATLRIREEGGQWNGGDGQRQTLLENALESLSSVDVEFASPLCDGICQRAREQGKPVIVSYHDFQKTPSLDALRTILAGMRTDAHVMPKIAAMVHSEADIAILRQLLAESADRPLCLIGMGEAGRQTRLDFARLGSCLTYGYLDRTSAPGQWPAADLVRALRESPPTTCTVAPAGTPAGQHA